MKVGCREDNEVFSTFTIFINDMPRTKTFDQQTITEKAMDLFWKKGYHNTSMQDLVDHLGINRASIYNTYGSKENLFVESLTYYQSFNGNILTSILDEAPNPIEGIHQLFERIVSRATVSTRNRGCFIVNCTTELLPHYKEFLPILLNNKKGFENLLKPTILRGQKMQLISQAQSASAIATYLFTLYSGIQVSVKLKRPVAEINRTISVGLQALNP